MDFLSQAWSKALKRARRDGLQLPGRFTARRLRASFITSMREAGIDSAILQKYVGHSPSSILAAHYDCVSIDRLAAIPRLAQELASVSMKWDAPTQASVD